MRIIASMEIGQHIKAFRKSKGINQTELGEIAGGFSKSAVSQWESDKYEPSIGAIERIAQHFGVLKSEILGEQFASPSLPKGAIRPVIAETVMVPLYGSIAAGDAIEMIDIGEEYPMFKIMAERYPKAFLLKVKGESMNKVLPNFTYAFVNPTSEVIDNKIYALNVNGNDATIKRVRQLNNGFELIPDSTDPTYESKIYDYGKPDTEQVRIIGRVVYHIVPFEYEY